jgi:hypothetical protein
MSATCPWCEAPRQEGANCPRCGANYAKAEAIRTHGRAEVVPAAAIQAEGEPEALIFTAADEDPEASAVIDDPQTEFRFCAAAIPLMLLVAIAFNAMEWGRFAQRLVFTMPVHELGHAVTAWLCGFGAIPTLWITITMEDRGFVAPLAILGAVGWMMHHGWQIGSRSLLLAGGAILALQLVCTLVISEDKARALIVFGGDGMGLVLSILLMASFFFGKTTQVYKGSLRWGFLAIGAAAFVDINAVWWAARRDSSEIPYTTRENGLESDALRLVGEFGWTESALVNRYIALCLVCMAVLALVYSWGVRKAWFKAQAAQRVS